MAHPRGHPPEHIRDEPPASGWSEGEPRPQLLRFLRRVLIAAAVAALLFLAWRARDAFLLVLAAVVVGVLLDAAARPIQRGTPLSRTWALTVAGVAIGAVVALLAWLVGSQVQAQVGQLVDQLSQGTRAIEQRVGLPLVGGGQQGGGGAWGDLLRRAASYGMTILDYDPGSRGAMSYLDASREIAERGRAKGGPRP